MELVSERNRRKFVHEGFSYVFDKRNVTGTTNFWRCERKSENCKARLHTTADENDAVTGHFGCHNHDSNQAGIEARQAINTLKRRATETRENTAGIINASMDNLSQAALCQLLKRNCQRKIIQSARINIAAAPPNPASAAELVLPIEWQQYEKQPGNVVQFLLADSGPVDNRILIFGTNEFADLLERSAIWYGDGTFDVAPPLFAQVYTILAESLGTVFPVLYCLLPNKTEDTYRRMLTMIHELRPDAAPQRFACDFEKAFTNAVRSVYPDCNICGCLFHLVKNVKKKIGEEGLLQRYNIDGDFALQARMITALAFVPPDDIEEKLDELYDIIPDPLLPVMSYFENTYVGRPRPLPRGGRRPLLFPAVMWSVYERTLNGDPRTKNQSEASNRRLKCELDVTHPSTWKFIDGLRTVQKGREAFREALVRGDPAPAKLMRYQVADRNILNIVRSYADRTTAEYLRGIAHNFQMNG